MKNILVLHGPNLSLLGTREPEIYGKTTLSDINEMIAKEAESLDLSVECQQFDSEGDIVSAVGSAAEEGFSGILINPAAYTHTSVAIHDAFKAVDLPAVEVHLSNIHARESFRKESLTAPAMCGQISGFGAESYLLGLRGLARIINGGA